MPAMPDLRRHTTATATVGRARRGVFALLLLALGLFAAAPSLSQAQQPSAPAPPAEAPAKPKVEPVPIAEIGVQTQQARRMLGRIMEELKPDPAVAAVEESFPDLSARVEQQLEAAAETTAVSPPLRTLDELNGRWNSLREELNGVQSTLSGRSAAVEARIEKIRDFGARWSATRAAALAADAPKEVLEQIDKVEAAVASAAERARSRQGSIVQLSPHHARSVPLTAPTSIAPFTRPTAPTTPPATRPFSR